MFSKPFTLGRLLLVAGACLFSHGCAEQQQSQQQPPPEQRQPQQQQQQPPQQPPQQQAGMEEPPPPPETNPTPDAAGAASVAALPPPTTAEVNGAVERVFKGAVTVEAGREPFFVVGNFNDDHSQDIAVAVRPAPGRLAELNDELASWILAAPFGNAASDSTFAEARAGAASRRRVVVDEGDVLLAVIHGFGPGGWRDSQATQTYVLKGAAGERLKTREQKQVLRAGGRERLPHLRGDVIAQSVGGQPGFLFYDGAKYSWYDPRNYKPAPPARVVHGGTIKSAPQ